MGPKGLMFNLDVPDSTPDTVNDLSDLCKVYFMADKEYQVSK